MERDGTLKNQRLTGVGLETATNQGFDSNLMH
jgi:hypothetical protein